jgi:hypothetical protein
MHTFVAQHGYSGDLITEHLITPLDCRHM